jgi:carbon monoxide dehydrogenase subunit G
MIIGMAHVEFTVPHSFDAPPRAVWDEMTDWRGHEAWIPATRVDVGPGDSRAVDATFTAYTGYGPLTLVDRMRVAEIQWDEATSTGRCVVEKLGPVLHGEAGFTVAPEGSGTKVEWFEKVTVRRLPGPLAPVVARLGAAGFSVGMRSLGKVLAKRPEVKAD